MIYERYERYEGYEGCVWRIHLFGCQLSCIISLSGDFLSHWHITVEVGNSVITPYSVVGNAGAEHIRTACDVNPAMAQFNLHSAAFGSVSGCEWL